MKVYVIAIIGGKMIVKEFENVLANYGVNSVNKLIKILSKQEKLSDYKKRVKEALSKAKYMEYSKVYWFHQKEFEELKEELGLNGVQ